MSVGLGRCGGTTRLGHRFCLWSQPPYRRTVAGRVLEAGIDAVWETQAGRGRKPQYDLSQRDALIAATLQTKPKGMTHWSCRLMAKAPRHEQEHGQPALAIA